MSVGAFLGRALVYVYFAFLAVLVVSAWIHYIGGRR